MPFCIQKILIRWFKTNFIIAVVVGFSPIPVLAACIGDQQSHSIYTISVVPQKPPAEIFSVWSQILEQIGTKTGMCFNLDLQANIPDFEAKLLAGDFDFAWMNPYHEVMAYKKRGYIPLVRDGQNPLQGLLVVKKDSPITSIEMLEGASVAFPSPNAFAASLLIRAMFDTNQVHIKPVYVKNHNNVYRATLVGDVKAGGGINNTLLNEPVLLQNELRVLFKTKSYAAHPLSVNPRVPVAARQAFTDAFLALSKDPLTERLLEKIPMPQPVVANYARDYEPLERMGLEKYAVTGSE